MNFLPPGAPLTRLCMKSRAGLSGLALCAAISLTQQTQAEAPASRQTITVPAPTEITPPGDHSVMKPTTPVTPAPLVPPLPEPPRRVPPPPIEQAAAPGNPAPDEWTVTITPLVKPNQDPMATRYRAVYESIPFRRAEYLANPSYRHDTTVEILFGQMRQMVIQRNDTPQRVVNPRPQLTQPYPLSKGELYSYWPLLQYSYPLPLLSPVE